jgi:hypothetical protein
MYRRSPLFIRRPRPPRAAVARLSRPFLGSPLFIRRPRPPRAAVPRFSRPFLWNLVAVVVAGVVVSWWLSAYTNYFPVVSTFLGLGGVLVWAGFAWNFFVDEKKQKSIRAAIVYWFETPWPNRVSWGVVVLVLLMSFCMGTIRVENIQGGDVTVQLDPGPTDDGGERLATGAERNYPIMVWPCRTKKVRVKVANLPTREVDIWSLWLSPGPKHLYVPGSFLRPVVLIGAEAQIVGNADASRQHLYVTVTDRNGKKTKLDAGAYDGQAVLVGTSDPDLPMPPGLQTMQKWHESLTSPNTANMMPPRFVAGQDVILPGAKVRGEITEQGTVQYSTDEIEVPQPTDRTMIVVPLLLKEKQGQ